MKNVVLYLYDKTKLKNILINILTFTNFVNIFILCQAIKFDKFLAMYAPWSSQLSKWVVDRLRLLLALITIYHISIILII